MVDSKAYADQEVISKVLTGEKAFFEIIVRRFNAALYKVGRGYGFDLEDTKDLMQETFINAYQHLKSFEGRSSFQTWLIRIMLNNCYRKKQKQVHGLYGQQLVTLQSGEEGNWRDAHNNTDRFMQRRELAHIIEQALSKVPYAYRVVFTLREINDLSVADTAGLLGISEGNVKVRLNRAKAMLKNEISKVYAPSDLFEFNLIHCDEIVAGVMGEILAG
jgi:RNA polymerase sigma-70 factor (ECF subfamily)